MGYANLELPGSLRIDPSPLLGGSPKKKMGSTFASTLSICIISSAENINPTLSPFIQRLGGFWCQLFLVVDWSFVYCQGLDVFRGK